MMIMMMMMMRTMMIMMTILKALVVSYNTCQSLARGLKKPNLFSFPMLTIRTVSYDHNNMVVFSPQPSRTS